MQMRALDRVGALLCPTKCILCRRVLFPEAELICPDCRPLTENDMLRAGVSFSGCVSLTEITLPAELEEIGENAFFCCYALRNYRCIN